MYSLLSTSVTVGFNLTSSPAFWVFLVCLMVVVALFVVTLVRQIIFTKNCEKFQQNLKVGDRVRTFGGVLGKVVSINPKADSKVVTLQTGEEKNVGYLSVDIKTIYCVDTEISTKTTK